MYRYAPAGSWNCSSQSLSVTAFLSLHCRVSCRLFPPGILFVLLFGNILDQTTVQLDANTMWLLRPKRVAQRAAPTWCCSSQRVQWHQLADARWSQIRADRWRKRQCQSLSGIGPRQEGGEGWRIHLNQQMLRWWANGPTVEAAGRSLQQITGWIVCVINTSNWWPISCVCLSDPL